MKKVLALSAAALLMTEVYAAESNVQVYGVIDAAVTGYKVKGQDAMLEFTSGFSMGNRIGIRGREDLGNGYSVGFDLEQGFLLDTGAQFNTWSKDGVVQNGAFNRQSYLDVTGPFGKIAFGRMVSLSGGTGDFNMAKWSPFGIGYGVASFIGYTFNQSRVNNALAYVSPSFDGFKVQAMYSNGTTTDDEKWSHNDHYYGIGAMYDKGSLNAELIFETLDNKSSEALKPAYVISAGGSYKFSMTKVFFGYQYGTQDNKRKQHMILLSSATPLAGGTLKFGGKLLLGKLDGKAKKAGMEDKYNSWNINAAYEYPLSKRTYVYGFAGYADGGKLLSGTASLKASGLPFRANMVNAWQLAVGMNHKF